MKHCVWALLAASAGFSQTPSISDIMGRVAANQGKSVEARKLFVYKQDEFVRMSRPNGQMECEQRREFTVTPSPAGIERQLVNPPEKEGEHARCTVDLSGDSGTSVSVSTGSEGDAFSVSMGKTKDGVPSSLFPLIGEIQKLYDYKLKGVEKFRGRDVYHVTFRPNHRKDAEGNGGHWKGDALIDAAEFQPVQVVTDLANGVPMPVKIFLGTNVHGLGFTVSYEKVADGVWFPSGFGGEFSIRALFFFKRTMSVNVKNSDFRKTDVNSDVTFGGVVK